MATSDLYRDYFLPWFGQGGNSGDVAIASRIRLARNFDRLPFPNRADMKQLAAVQGLSASVFNEIEVACGTPCDVVGIDGLSEMERQVLAEKYLVSEDFIRNSAYRSAYISANRGTSILVNEEDHLRIQCMTAGLNLKEPLTMAMQIDDAVESRLDLAFDEKMGYLTSCPTNLGTGLRATVLLHLPGLTYTRNMHNIIHISQQIGLSVEGLYGEGSEAAGNVFAMSNQLTLGLSETDIIENLTGAVMEVIEHERRARKALLLYSKERLEDAIWRAYGILQYARALGGDEVLELMSKVRLGMDLGLLHEVQRDRFGDVLLASRPNYIRNLAGTENLSPPELDRRRAEVVRRVLAGDGKERE